MKKDRLKIGKFYVIKWVDTWSRPGWFTIKEIKDDAKKGEEFITAVGIYIGTYSGFVVLCSQHATAILTSSGLGAPNFIPIGCIKKIKEIK